MPDKTPVIIAHRGSPSTHPELTLEGYQEAISAGADYLEMDLQVSSDYVPFLHHDPTVNGRTCRTAEGKRVRKPIPVSKLTAKELDAFDVGKNFTQFFPRQKALKAAPLLRFSRFLDWFGESAPEKTKLLIELKFPPKHVSGPVDRNKYISSVLGRIKKYGLLRRVNIQSYDHKLLRICQDLAPSLKVSYLYDYHKEWHKHVHKWQSPKASIYFWILAKNKIDYCRERGIAVYVYTVNTPKQWERCLRFGVSGLITDYPRRLRKYLDRPDTQALISELNGAQPRVSA